MSFSQLKKLLSNYEKEQRASSFIVWTEQMGLWIGEFNLLVTQIMVRDNYPGKVLGEVGIGDTLSDVKKVFGEVIHESYVWKVSKLPGLAFELSQDSSYDDWYDNGNEQNIPIDTISIFPATYQVV